MAIKNLETGEVRFQGEVLSVREDYLGCDRYAGIATVWTGTARGTFTVWTSYCDMMTRTHEAETDATPDVLEAVRLYDNEQARLVALRWEQKRQDELARSRAHLNALQDLLNAVPARGAKVVVTNNRSAKAKKGEVGEVFWKGVNKFDPDKISVGIVLADGRKVYLNASAVKAA